MASQEREYPSLLFTPQPQQKQGDGARARSPRSTRSPSTPAYNRTGLYREGSGSRRRSLTPTGSVRDTPPPPPPPSMSYLNADGGEASEACYVQHAKSKVVKVSFHQYQEGDLTSICSTACRRTSQSIAIRATRYYRFPRSLFSKLLAPTQNESLHYQDCCCRV